jgi:fucose 4-O-acetylase-like acetyltransferase
MVLIAGAVEFDGATSDGYYVNNVVVEKFGFVNSIYVMKLHQLYFHSFRDNWIFDLRQISVIAFRFVCISNCTFLCMVLLISFRNLSCKMKPI